MSPRQQARLTQQCAWELWLKITESECILLPEFVQCLTEDSAHWYPQWILLRKTLFNIAYMTGLAGGGQSNVDWRCFVFIVLSVSVLVQLENPVFTHREMNHMEEFSLQILVVCVALDLALPPHRSLQLVVPFALLMAVVVVYLGRLVDNRRRREVDAAHHGWARVHKDVTRGQLSSNNAKVENPVCLPETE